MPGGIPIPKDRTTQQRPRAYCMNPQCRDVSDEEFHFNVENDHFACPKCGNNQPPGVGLLVLTHLLVPDRKGPIVGENGSRWRLGCEQKRAYLATVTNLEAATGDPAVANCTGCLAEAARLGITQAGGTPVVAEPPMLARITIDKE
jgi:hypothetical protein